MQGTVWGTVSVCQSHLQGFLHNSPLDLVPRASDSAGLWWNLVVYIFDKFHVMLSWWAEDYTWRTTVLLDLHLGWYENDFIDILKLMKNPCLAPRPLLPVFKMKFVTWLWSEKQMAIYLGKLILAVSGSVAFLIRVFCSAGCRWALGISLFMMLVLC